MMSPALWRELIKPHLERVFAVGQAARSAGGLSLLRRAARRSSRDLIEMGLDVLNPIQCNCPGHGRRSS